MLEFKLFFFDKVLKKLSYQQTESYVTELENYIFAKESPNKFSLLAYQVNPIKAAMQLLNTLIKIQRKFPMFSHRLKLLKVEILDQTKCILENLYLPAVIDCFVKSFDIFNKQIIVYMESYDAFELMETKAMDNVLRKMWSGSTETGGCFFSLSVCYKVLTKEYCPSYKKDYERTHRLRVRGRLDDIRHHGFTFKNYRKAMDLRY